MIGESTAYITNKHVQSTSETKVVNVIAWSVDANGTFIHTREEINFYPHFNTVAVKIRANKD